jgi:hypothetical protein
MTGSLGMFYEVSARVPERVGRVGRYVVKPLHRASTAALKRSENANG